MRQLLRRCPPVRGLASAFIVLLLAASMPDSLDAQVRRDTAVAPAGPPAETDTQFMMQQQVEMMGPMMDQMMQSMMQGMLRVLVRPETARQFATFTKNYFDALVANGFSREDALRIVMAHGIPALPTGR